MSEGAQDGTSPGRARELALPTVLSTGLCGGTVLVLSLMLSGYAFDTEPGRITAPEALQRPAGVSLPVRATGGLMDPGRGDGDALPPLTRQPSDPAQDAASRGQIAALSDREASSRAANRGADRDDPGMVEVSPGVGDGGTGPERETRDDGPAPSGGTTGPGGDRAPADGGQGLPGQEPGGSPEEPGRSPGDPGGDPGTVPVPPAPTDLPVPTCLPVPSGSEQPWVTTPDDDVDCVHASPGGTPGSKPSVDRLPGSTAPHATVPPTRGTELLTPPTDRAASRGPASGAGEAPDVPPRDLPSQGVTTGTPHTSSTAADPDVPAPVRQDLDAPLTTTLRTVLRDAIRASLRFVARAVAAQEERVAEAREERASLARLGDGTGTAPTSGHPMSLGARERPAGSGGIPRAGAGTSSRTSTGSGAGPSGQDRGGPTSRRVGPGRRGTGAASPPEGTTPSRRAVPTPGAPRPRDAVDRPDGSTAPERALH